MKQNTHEIFKKFQKIGKAISRVNANNTHSGNISIKDSLDPDIFYITASGSQSCDLVEQDIVPIRFSGVSWGDARGSTESTIHREILKLPEANAAIHAHYLNSTFISFDTKEKQLFSRFHKTDKKNREEFIFQPVDLFGAFVIGQVRVASFDQPVGSAEMDERIPLYLEKDRLTIVRGHGPFARGTSPEDAFYRLSVLENSAKLLIFLRRRGVDTGDIQQKIMDYGIDQVFSKKPYLLDQHDFLDQECDDPSILEDFCKQLNYNYNNTISAYGTGSMSQKISSDEMIFCPMSAVPEDFNFPLYRVSLEIKEDDPMDLSIHKLIYRQTHQNACMITTSPLATAEGMAVLAERYGKNALLGMTDDIHYTAKDHPTVMPIDGEAIYLNPKLGLVDITQLTKLTSENPILNMLRWYKGCCIVAGYGVISTGETTLEQAAHNASSAERIARFRAEVFINQKILDGPGVKLFEPAE